MTKKDWWVLLVFSCIIITGIVIYIYDHKFPSEPQKYETLLADDAELMKGYNDAVFYEGDITLDSIGHVLKADNVFQAGDTCVIFHHSGDSLWCEVVNDYWMECCVMPVPLPMTLDKAIDIYKNSELYNGLHMVVARNILGPVIHNPQYIFGTLRTGFVTVDMVTGEVGTLSSEITTDSILYKAPGFVPDSLVIQ